MLELNPLQKRYQKNNIIIKYHKQIIEGNLLLKIELKLQLKQCKNY